MFEVQGVTKRYVTRDRTLLALDRVDLSTPPGGITALLGPSGSGKSTLLRVLAGFETPDEGEVRIDGKTVASPTVFVPPQRRRVGIVTQEGSLFPHLDVAGNVAYGLPGTVSRIFSTSVRHKREARVDELLTMVGLDGLGKRRPDELSGGQQQRVALARALAPEPAAILLDEPFSALDAGLRVELREEVCALLRTLAATTVLVTHDQGEALSLADQVVILRDGRVVQSGTPTSVYANPVDVATADLLGDVLILPATVDQEAQSADCVFGRVGVGPGTLAPGGRTTYRLVLRPEQLQLGDHGVGATVTDTSFYGHDAMVRLDVDGIDSPVLVRTSGELPPPGAQVKVAVAAGATAHLLPIVETLEPSS